MTSALVTAAARAPHIDWAAMSPYIALAAGGVVVLMAGVFTGRAARHVTPLLSLVALLATIGLSIWRLGDATDVISGALRVDDLALTLNFVLAGAGIAAVLLSWRSRAAATAGHAEYYALLLLSLLGMAALVAAQNLVTLFLAFELLSIPLYVLCAAEFKREGSLESGLKYLIVGSVGSATLLYGLALIYGAAGSTDFVGIDRALADSAIRDDVLLLTGVGLTLVGLAFKASVAPFHQWTPDVYEGAPTPVTAFMAVATKVAAFGVLLRLFDVALVNAQLDWAPAVAALAAVTIIVGNVGALAQSSLKRMLAYSGVAQAGYLLCGLVVGTQLGVKATVFYLVVYLAMNAAAFAVIVARERATAVGDDISAVAGLGRSQPLLAWPLTLAMLGLAGIPATAGFIGKFYLIDALVDGGYAWLGIVLVVGSMISLGYYLRVIATMWMGDAGETVPASSVPAPATPAPAAAGAPPVMAGGSQEADDLDERVAGDRTQPEVLVVAWIATAAIVFFGIIPSPLFELAGRAGASLTGIF
ncbi:NADH-quinone oxidoreductase subunit N [Conexibacter woesei]|uniref:NADH-quinone oxidoreductase subunit N n=1 Tax=Conexibacter woesei (strain DSM 14684 / CCUG 47730 / CIP 108061 / JCM 11494 / NBRC 100937 / ID131577) TaxID=469383 RepID=D3FDL9_CONWI|nr:NADH-quinone oxidoreductase subunit N [Conexibacter woesei]ADB49593.1 proton-translocating NADH-quinone oxidoreductase, chain N [Conexibacter woesei DSM 14684]